MKTTSLKSPKNWHFSKGFNLWFLSKNGNFCQLFYSGNIGQQNVFYDILERKKAFLGYKNKKFKKSKNWHFSKGVNPWFWSKKWPFFQLFFLGSIGQENVFYDILKQKNAFLAYKNKKLKKSRNWNFFKEVFQTGFPKLVLVQKWPFFQLFFFGNRGLDNVFYNIVKVKNAFLGYRNKKFKKFKNLTFFRRG